MYINKVILMIVLCATSGCCNDGTFTRKVRTISSSFFTWPQTLLRDRPSLSTIQNFWSNRVQFRELAKNGIVGLLRFVSADNENKPVQIKFGPEDGLRAAAAYQRRYGYRGEQLIEQLGSGFDPDIQPAPNIFLKPPLPPFGRW